MKVSFITTVFNEEKTIHAYLTSILTQSTLPDELIIVDAESSDNTITIIKRFMSQAQQLKTKLYIKKGNRSVGRNEAIKIARNNIIVCSDAGNELDRNWIRYITKPFSNKNVDVVAGYYKGKSDSTFQKSVIPYAFVMPDRVNPETFLPATRSIAFSKDIWKKVGGFDEKLSHNEDYAFAHALKRCNAKIIFVKEAIVYWIPRDTLKSVYIMFIRFAYGDAEARIFRPKVILLFIRYITGVMVLAWAILSKSEFLLFAFIVLFFLYILWAIWKNYKYVMEWEGIYFLPLLQLTSDAAVMIGTIQGIFKAWDTKKTL